MTDYSALPVAEFAFPGPLRDQFVGAILDGSKTSTTATLSEYAIEEEDLPYVGGRELVVDSTGRVSPSLKWPRFARPGWPKLICSTPSTRGKGHTSVAQWRAGHEEFWRSAEMREAMGDPEFTVDDDSLVVLQRFRVVERLA